MTSTPPPLLLLYLCLPACLCMNDMLGLGPGGGLGPLNQLGDGMVPTLRGTGGATDFNGIRQGSNGIMLPIERAATPSPPFRGGGVQRNVENGAIQFGQWGGGGMAGMLSEPMHTPHRPHEGEDRPPPRQQRRGQHRADAHTMNQLEPFAMQDRCDCCEPSGTPESACHGNVGPDGACCFEDSPRQYCKAPRTCSEGGGAGRQAANTHGGGLDTLLHLRRRRR